MLRALSKTQGRSASSHDHRACEENGPLHTSASRVSRGDPPTTEGTEERAVKQDQNPQLRKLNLRKARFRAAPVPPRSFTPPTGGIESPDLGYDADTLENVESSPSETRQAKSNTRHENADDVGVLREISNSSLRGKKRCSSQGQNQSFASSKTTRAGPARSPRATIDVNDTKSPPSGSGAVGGSAKSSQAKSSDTPGRQRSRRACDNSGKPSQSRQAGLEDETAQYMEHLESQLAAMETQLNSIGSPSSIKSQAAKLRALTAECKILREEVADWDEKFEDRVHEQLEEHEITIRGLRAQLRLLQKLSDASDAKSKAAEAETGLMREQLEAAERLNQDLERRIEVMSELVATSPTKTCFDDGPLPEKTRRSPSRPISRILPVSSQHRPSVATQRHSVSFDGQCSPTSPSLSRGRNLDDRRATQAAARPLPHRWSSTDPGSETSEQTLVNDSIASPDRRRWTTQFLQSDSETRTRPGRRMRRFYAGSNGPRALILPVTAQTGPLVTSAPVTAAQTPSIPAQELANSLEPLGLGINHATPSRSKTFPADPETSPGTEELLQPTENSSTLVESWNLESSPASTVTPQRSAAHDVHNIERQPIKYRDSMTPNDGETLFQELIRLESRTENENSEDSEVRSPELQPASVLASTKRETDQAPFDLADSPSEYDVQKEPEAPFREDCADPPPPMPSVRIPVLDRLTTMAFKSMDHRAPRIKFFLMNAWSMLTLSRPVLEFRWWLVKLLVGGLRRRKRRSASSLQPSAEEADLSQSTRPTTKPTADEEDAEPQSDKSPSSETSCASPSRAPRSYDGEQGLWNIFETRDKYKHATPPPVSWLKFSITLVFAVGIAIKDGPASLFGNRHRGSQRHKTTALQRPREKIIPMALGALDSDDEED